MTSSWTHNNGIGRRYLINNYPDVTLRALGRSIMDLPSFHEICEKVGVVWHMNTGIVSRLSDGKQASQQEVSDYVYELWMDPACREAFESHDVFVTDMRTGKPAVPTEELTPEDLAKSEGDDDDDELDIDDWDNWEDDEADGDGVIPMVGWQQDYSLEAIANLLQGKDDAEVETSEET